jgi:hypothetical protein
MIKFNVIDRRTYLYEGSWQSPTNDLTEKIFYYYLQPLTLALTNEFAKQAVKPTCVIGVHGEHKFVKGDVITLHDGLTLQVTEQTFVYRTGNIAVRHMLKSKVQETQVVLE